jgi:1,4-dihydroxy-2-naphthoate octaprenyltransferase
MTTTFSRSFDHKLWLAALKPPMYTVAVIPITVGSALAFTETQTWHSQVFWTFMSSAILITAWLNLSNDVFDAETGIDKNKAHSVVNLTGNKSVVFWIANLCLALGIAGIFVIAWWQRDPMLLGIIALCCALGYSYQGPPFRLGYLGLGEVICFICFGPLAIAAAYYAQTQTFSVTSLVTSTLIGISTSIILFCSHFHQVSDDLAAGKRSPIVRLGTAKGAKVLALSILSLFPLTAILVLLHITPWTTLLISLSFPVALELIRHVQQYHDQPEKVSNCKFIAVKLHFWSGCLLSLGLVLPHFL